MTTDVANRDYRGVPDDDRTTEASQAEFHETAVTRLPTGQTTERRQLGGGETAPGAATTSRTVIRDVAAERRRTVAQVNQVIWYVVGVGEALIALRFALNALGANPATDFVRLIDGVTYPLVWPFIGVFPSPASGPFILELSSLAAMLVYFLLGMGLARLSWIIYGEPHDTA